MNCCSNFRFSKIACVDENNEQCNSNTITRLQDTDYPILSNVHRWISTTTNAISVVYQDDREVHYDIHELILAAYGIPYQPGDSEFSDLLLEVVKVQKKRVNDPNVPLFVLPDAWKDKDLNEVAEAVHDEYPGLHQYVLLDEMFKGTYGPVVIDTTIVPRRSMSTFLRKQVLLAEMNTWSISFIGPHNFGAKYYVGRARPEVSGTIIWFLLY